ncbi:hypothetical protein HFN76_36000 [Rhizobium laguerreae]|nr:hypothetical protein [Rhizobium laguerreae]MBY3517435.1 hypothetical protein [Rhizobium laguerreae]
MAIIQASLSCREIAAVDTGGEGTRFAEGNASRLSFASHGKCEWSVSGRRPMRDIRRPMSPSTVKHDLLTRAEQS